MKYGSGSSFGTYSSDQVCLLPDNDATCIQDMKQLSVVKTTGLEGLAAAGILGLSPATNKGRSTDFIGELYDVRTSLVLYLFNLAWNYRLKSI